MKQENVYITHNGKEYVAVYEVPRILGLSDGPKNYLKTFSEIVKIKNTAYISIEEFEERRLFHEMHILIVDALKMDKVKLYGITENDLSQLKSVIKLNPKNKYAKRYIEKGELAYLIEERKQIAEEYINIAHIDEVLGFPLSIKQIKKFRSCINILSSLYVKKSEVLELRKLKDETISLKEFIEVNGIKYMHYSSVYKTIERFGIEVLKFGDHQLSNTLIYKKDIEEILIRLNKDVRLKEVMKNGNGLELYRERIRDIPNKIETKETMEIFNNYVKERFMKKNTKRSNIDTSRMLYGTHQILSKVFFTEFVNYSKGQIDAIVEAVSENEGIYRQYPARSRFEFVQFINYLIIHLKLKDREPYIVDRNDFENISEEGVVAYTQRQFLQLFALLHQGIFNRTFLEKAIKERSIAMTWLYMYLHFVSLWRSSDYLEKLVSPSLDILKSSEFHDGESFLNWLSNQKHILTDDKNGFTEVMGMAITEDVKRKMHAILPKISKTNESLYIEVGQLMSPILGLLLSICEAHRQVAEESGNKTYKTDGLITATVKGVIGTIFDGKVIDILGDNFKNTRANKSYNDYIHDYSEENGRMFAAQMISIMRGYKDIISETTAKYETRWVDGRYNSAMERLWDSGTFCGFKLKFLDIVGQGKIAIAETETQDEMIKELSLTTYQCELIVKNVYNHRKIVMDLISRMSLNPDKIKELMCNLAFNNTDAKHNHTKCLFKAFLLTYTDDSPEIGEMSFYEYIKTYRNETNCLHPDFDTCFGCPMLIGELFFLYELNSVFWDTITNLKKCNNEYEQYIYTNLLLCTYYPILIEAQSALGKEKVNLFINSIAINKELEMLQDLGIMRLDFNGGLSDSHITTIG